MFSPDNIFTTTIDKAVRWSRTQSMWPVTFGLACCAIEMWLQDLQSTTWQDMEWRYLEHHQDRLI